MGLWYATERQNQLLYIRINGISTFDVRSCIQPLLWILIYKPIKAPQFHLWSSHMPIYFAPFYWRVATPFTGNLADMITFVSHSWILQFQTQFSTFPGKFSTVQSSLNMTICIWDIIWSSWYIQVAGTVHRLPHKTTLEHFYLIVIFPLHPLLQDYRFLLFLLEAASSLLWPEFVAIPCWKLWPISRGKHYFLVSSLLLIF